MKNKHISDSVRYFLQEIIDNSVPISIICNNLGIKKFKIKNIMDGKVCIGPILFRKSLVLWSKMKTGVIK